MPGSLVGVVMFDKEVNYQVDYLLGPLFQLHRQVVVGPGCVWAGVRAGDQKGFDSNGRESVKVALGLEVERVGWR